MNTPTSPFLFCLSLLLFRLFLQQRFPGYGSFFDNVDIHTYTLFFSLISTFLPFPDTFWNYFQKEHVFRMVERTYNSIRTHKQTRLSQRPISKKTSSTMRETFGSQVLRELEMKNRMECPSLDEIFSFYHFPWEKFRYRKNSQKKKRSTLYSFYFEQVNSGRIQFSFVILLSICISEAIFSALGSSWLNFSILCVLTLVISILSFLHAKRTELVCIASIISCVIISACTSMRTSVTYLLIFSTYSLLPMSFMLMIFSTFSLTFLVAFLGVLSDYTIGYDIILTRIMMVILVNIVGSLVYYPTEFVQRKTFHETR
ncbi:hypothetical protein B9Z55_019702 [Caenorhabditis nigoni]|uniref:Uncharacterized protein n=1 Tax=Caenorhabditis nigoni TaxID=1611254 RepID=A0A2G5TK35_9PELO|nr:hypothetical protein B9Z55_019702 [Caenorhabditis nigoni]